LSGTQFSTLNSAGINDPEGPEKYNNTEVKEEVWCRTKVRKEV
jgi:hypothetical protein